LATSALELRSAINCRTSRSRGREFFHLTDDVIALGAADVVLHDD
jgi:hypothetical protein